MTQFYLVRHGEPEWEMAEERKLIGGRRDLIPLTYEGAIEVEKVALDPRLKQAEIIVSSPYTRAMHTAALINRELGLPFKVEFDLHEWVPDLTMRYESYGEFLELVADFQKHEGTYPEGESRNWETWESLHGRVKGVLKKYLDYSHVIIVCHGMVIESQTKLAKVPHAGIVEFNVEENMV